MKVIIRRLKIIVMFLVTLMLFGCIRLEHENGLRFYLNTATQEYSVFGGNLSGDIVIPSIFKGKPVTEIMGYGFWDNLGLGSFSVGDTKEMKSIYIPASIRVIGPCPFVNCAMLETITVAPDNPFYKSENNCLIERATNILISGCANSIIPEYITAISQYAFHGSKPWNEALENEIFYFDNWAIDYRGKLRGTIEIKSGTVGIGDSAFSNHTNLEKVILPDTLVRIGSHAFDSCERLKEIVIPISVAYIAGDSFNGCGLNTIYVEAESKPPGWPESWHPYQSTVIWGYVSETS